MLRHSNERDAISGRFEKRNESKLRNVNKQKLDDAEHFRSMNPMSTISFCFGSKNIHIQTRMNEKLRNKNNQRTRQRTSSTGQMRNENRANDGDDQTASRFNVVISVFSFVCCSSDAACPSIPTKQVLWLLAGIETSDDLNEDENRSFPIQNVNRFVSRVFPTQ